MNDNKNGYVKWWQLVSSFLVLLGIVVTSAWAFAGYVHNSDCELAAKVDTMQSCFNVINDKLSRIEERQQFIIKKVLP